MKESSHNFLETAMDHRSKQDFMAREFHISKEVTKAQESLTDALEEATIAAVQFKSFNKPKN